MTHKPFTPTDVPAQLLGGWLDLHDHLMFELQQTALYAWAEYHWKLAHPKEQASWPPPSNPQRAEPP